MPSIDFSIDLHCHPTYKPFGKSYKNNPGVQSADSNNESSLWYYDPPSLIDKLVTDQAGWYGCMGGRLFIRFFSSDPCFPCSVFCLKGDLGLPGLTARTVLALLRKGQLSINNQPNFNSLFYPLPSIIIKCKKIIVPIFYLLNYILKINRYLKLINDRT